MLILTAQTGGGHMSLATALRELLAPIAEATIVDPLPRSIAAQYRLMSRHARWLWAAGYALTDTPNRALLLHRFFAWRFARSLERLLKERPYRLVITTYPFLSYEVTWALKRLQQPIPFIALFADPERVHSTWLSERNSTATFAPTRETYAQAIRAGFAPERLHLTGWPVRRQFYANDMPGRAATLRALQLEPERFTVFVQGGGEGSAGFVECVMALLAAGVPQILLAVGSNQHLGERFRNGDQVRIIPYTETIAPLMAAADLVVGKAGPNTLMEAVALERPFLATTYIPGQEEGNLAFIERHRLGWSALNPRQQRGLAEHLLSEPAEMAAIRASVRQYRAWNIEANQVIIRTIAELYA